MNKEIKIILSLSVMLSFVIGGVLGYFVGENRAISGVSDKYISSQSKPNTNQESSQEDTSSDIPSVDYTQFVINKDQNVTVEDFYPDEESKDLASKIIGTALPNMSWKNADGTELSTKDMTGKYIVEIFSPSCAFCLQSAPEVESFRTIRTDLPIVSLTTVDGDISEFGANAFKMSNSADTTVNKFLSNVPWVPTFLFVEDGNIKLITFGGVTFDSLEQYSELAFGTVAK